MSEKYLQRLEKFKKILRVKLTEVIGNDRDEDAATYLGTSVSTFRRWKNGSQMPDTETLLLIAEKMEISLDWFLLGKGESKLVVKGDPPSEREASLERENVLLRERLVDKEELIASQKETIAMQKQMLRQVCAPLGESAGAPGFAARQSATDTPARGARTSTARPKYIKSDMP